FSRFKTIGRSPSVVVGFTHAATAMRELTVNSGSSGTCTMSLVVVNWMPWPLMPATHLLFKACCALKWLPDESIKKLDVGEQSSTGQNPLGPPRPRPPSKPPVPPPANPLPPNPLPPLPPTPVEPPVPRGGPASTIGGRPASPLPGGVAAGMTITWSPLTIV